MTRPLVSRSELDRRLRAAEDAHRRSLPRWRDLLDRALTGPDRPASDEVAALLGVPTRRQVLRIGGLGVAGAALLAACSSDDDEGDPGTQPSETSSPPEEPDPAGPELDVVLANTAISLEILAIDTYQAAIDVGLVQSSEVLDAVTLFQAHHAEHRDVLVGVVEGAGAEPFRVANPVVKAAFVDPALYSAASEGDAVRLAYEIEQAAAQTYVYAAGTLSTAELRSTAMSIGGVEARHAAIFEALGDLSNDKPARYPTTNPLPSDAMVED